MDNQRKFERKNCVVPVDGKQGSEFDHLQTIDISKGGVGFISDHELPLNKRIPIELNLTSEEDPVVVIGTVRWVDPIVGTKSYRIGVAFEEVEQESEDSIQQYFQSAE